MLAIGKADTASTPAQRPAVHRGPSEMNVTSAERMVRRTRQRGASAMNIHGTKLVPGHTPFALLQLM